MDIILWFLYGLLLGLVVLVYFAIIGFVMYFVLCVAFALFEALKIPNPFIVLWNDVTKFLKGRKGE